MAEYSYSKILTGIRTKLEEEFQDEMSKIDFNKLAIKALKEKGIDLASLVDINQDVLIDILGEAVSRALQSDKWKSKIHRQNVDISDLIDLNGKDLDNKIKEYYDGMQKALDKGDEQLAKSMRDSFMKAMMFSNQRNAWITNFLNDEHFEKVIEKYYDDMQKAIDKGDKQLAKSINHKIKLNESRHDWALEYQDLLTQRNSDFKLDKDEDVIIDNKKIEKGLTESAQKYQKWTVDIGHQFQELKEQAQGVGQEISNSVLNGIANQQKKVEKSLKDMIGKDQLEIVDQTKNMVRNMSDIGLTADQMREKLRLEAEEIKKGNMAFKERITLLKNNVVVDSLIGNGKSTSIDRDLLLSKEYDFLMHTHPDNEPGAYNFGNYDVGNFVFDKEFTSIFKKAELITNGITQVILDFANMTSEQIQQFSFLYDDAEHTVRAAFGKMQEDGRIDLHGADYKEVSKYLNALGDFLIKDLGGNLQYFQKGALDPNRFKQIYDEFLQAHELLEVIDLNNGSALDDIVKSQRKVVAQAMYDNFHNSGKEIVDAMVNEATQRAEEVKQASTESAKILNEAVQDGIAEGTDSHSPSKEAEKQADNVVDGFVQEIDQRLPEVEKVGEKIGESVKDGIKESIKDLPSSEDDIEAYLAQLDAKVGLEIKPQVETKEIEQTKQATDAIFKKAESLEELREQYRMLKQINNDIAVYEDPDNYIKDPYKGGKQFVGFDKKKTGSGYEDLKDFKKELLELNPILNEVADSSKRISKKDFEQMFGSYFESPILNTIEEVTQLEVEMGNQGEVATEKIKEGLKEIQQEAKETQKLLYHWGSDKGLVADDMRSTITHWKEGKQKGEPYGMFGTGTYAVSNPNLFNGVVETLQPFRSPRKYLKIDASKLNLYETKTSEHAQQLMEYLETLQQYCISFATGYDWEGTFDVAEWSPEKLYNLYKSVFKEATLDFEQFNAFLTEMYAVVQDQGFNKKGNVLKPKNQVKTGRDSISTRFMKLLGYNGVNNTGTNKDNFVQGSVIFNLPDDAVIKRTEDLLELTKEYNESPLITNTAVATELQLTETTEKANTVIDEQKQKISELESQVNDLESSLRAQSDELQHAYEEQGDLQSQLDREKGSSGYLEEALQEQKRISEELQDQNEELKKQNDFLKENNDYLQSEKTFLEGVKEELQTSVEDERQARKEAKARADTYEEISRIATRSEAEADEKMRLEAEARQEAEKQLDIKKEENEELKKQLELIQKNTSLNMIFDKSNIIALEESLNKISVLLEDIRNTLGTIDDNNGFQSILASVKDLLSQLDEMYKKIGTGIYNIQIHKGSDKESVASQELTNSIIRDTRARYQNAYQKVVQKAGSEELLFANIYSATAQNFSGGLDALYEAYSPINISKIQSAEEQVFRMMQFFDLLRNAMKSPHFDLNLKGLRLPSSDDSYFRQKLRDSSIINTKETEIEAENLENEAFQKANENLDQVINKLEEIKNILEKIGENNPFEESLNNILDNINQLIEKFKELDASLLTNQINQIQQQLDLEKEKNTELDKKINLLNEELNNEKAITEELKKQSEIKNQTALESKNVSDKNSSATPKKQKEIIELEKAYKGLTSTEEKYAILSERISNGEQLNAKQYKELAVLKNKRQAYFDLIESMKQSGIVNLELEAQYQKVQTQNKIIANDLIKNENIDNYINKIKQIKNSISSGIYTPDSTKGASAFINSLPDIKSLNLDQIKKYYSALEKFQQSFIKNINVSKNVDINKNISKDDPKIIKQIENAYRGLTKTELEYTVLQERINDNQQLTAAQQKRFSQLELERQGYLDVINSVQVLSDSMDTLKTKYNNFQTSIPDIAKNFIKDEYVDSYYKKVSKIEKLISSGKYTNKSVGEAENYLNNLHDISNEDIDSIKKYNDELDILLNQTLKKAGNETKLTKLINNVTDELQKNSRMPKQLADDFKNLKSQMEEFLTSGNYTTEDVKKLTNAFIALDTELINTGKKGDSFFTTIAKDIRSSSARIIAQYLSFQDLIRYARSAVQAVTQLDTALTQLRVVSNASEAELRRVANSAYEMANALGSSTTEITNSITEWRRLGYTIEESQKLAEAAAKLSTGGLMDVNSATTSLISSMQAFKDMGIEAEDIVDQYIYLGNNFAISSQELATSLTKSMAALKVAGNSLEEIEALEVAGNTIVQEADTVSNSLKVNFCLHIEKSICYAG